MGVFMLNNVLDNSNIKRFVDNYTYRDMCDMDDMAFDIEAINNGISNVLTTMKGSMPGKPNFGSELHLIPFSQLDYVTENAYKLSITQTLKTWETRIRIKSIDITSSAEYNQIIADINYTYNDDIDSTVSVSLSDL